MASNLDDKIKDILAGANDTPTTKQFRLYGEEVELIKQAFHESGWISPEEIRGEEPRWRFLNG